MTHRRWGKDGSARHKIHEESEKTSSSLRCVRDLGEPLYRSRSVFNGAVRLPLHQYETAIAGEESVRAGVLHVDVVRPLRVLSQSDGHEAVLQLLPLRRRVIF